MMYSISSTKLCLALTIVASTSMVLIECGSPCSPYKPCTSQSVFGNDPKYFHLHERFLQSCRHHKIHCCYNTTKYSCTEISDGSSMKGICTCVVWRQELIEFTKGLEVNPGQGCLNHEDCRLDPELCYHGTHCDCEVDYGKAYHGECKDSKPAKCRCNKGASYSG